jgi:hypothetical protein
MFGVTRRPRTPLFFLALSLLATSLLLPSAGVTAGEKRPYRLAVEVLYGNPDGPDSMIEEIELSLTHALASAGCFESVVAHTGVGSPKADLLFRVYLDDYLERTEFDVSQAVALSPRSNPDVKNQVRVAFSALVHLELLTVVNPAKVRGSRFAQNEYYRPMLQEDPRDGARRILVEGVVGKGRKFACKGSAKKLAKEITAAKPLADPR